MRTLGLYFAQHFLRNVFWTFLLFFALVVAVGLIDQTRATAGADDVAFLDLLTVSALNAPWIVENIIPFCVLFGSIATLLLLNRRLELVVARAAGVSVWQFLFPASIVALLVGLFAALVFNPLAIRAQNEALAIEDRVFGKIEKAEVRRNFWIAAGTEGTQQIYNASVARNEGRRLVRVVINTFRPDGSPGRRIDASRLDFEPRPEGNVWVATNARVYERGERGRVQKRIEIPTDLTADQLREVTVDERRIAFWDLDDEADAARNAARSTLPYETRFHALLSRPLLYLAMVLLAGTVSLRFARFGIDGWGLAIGVTLGFVLYAVAELALTFGRNGLVAPAVAAWGPVVVAVLLGTSVLLQKEDG